MKYDSALVLQLLQLVEASPPNSMLPLEKINLPDISRETLRDHLKLLLDEKILNGFYREADDQAHIDLAVTSLTLTGHQLLAIARDQTRWKKFIRLAQAGVGFVTKEGFKAALTETVKNLLT